MTNLEIAVKMLKDAGYQVTTIHDHTVVASDPIHCSSGNLKWRETRQVPMNVSKDVSRVTHFISERE